MSDPSLHSAAALPNICLPPLTIPPPTDPAHNTISLPTPSATSSPGLLGFKPLVVPGTRALRGSLSGEQGGGQIGVRTGSIAGWSGSAVGGSRGSESVALAYRGISIPIRARGRLPLKRSRSGIPPPIIIPQYDIDPKFSANNIKLENEHEAEVNPETKRRVVMYQPESPTRTGKNRYQESGKVIDGAVLSKQPRRKGPAAAGTRVLPVLRKDAYHPVQQPIYMAGTYGNIGPNGALVQPGRVGAYVAHPASGSQLGQADLETLAEINSQYRNVQALQGRAGMPANGSGHGPHSSISGSSVASDWVEMSNRTKGMGIEGGSAGQRMALLQNGSASSSGSIPQFQPPELSTSCGSPTSMGSSVHEIPSSTQSGGSLILPKIEPESPPAFPQTYQQPYPAFQSVPLMNSQAMPQMYYTQGGGAGQPGMPYQSWMIPHQGPGPISAARVGKKGRSQALPMMAGHQHPYPMVVMAHPGHLPYGTSPRANPYPPVGGTSGKGKKKLLRHGEREVQGVPQYVLDTGVSPELKARFDACEHLEANSPLAKPNRTYASLVAEAILSAPYPHQLNIAEIFHSVSSKYPYFSYKPIQIYNGIRHATTQSQHFIKLDRQFDDQSGKGRYWTIKPGSEALFKKPAASRSSARVKQEMSSEAGSLALSSRMQSPAGSVGMSMSAIGSEPAPQTPGMQVDKPDEMDVTPTVQLNNRVADTTPRPAIPFRIPPIQEPRTGNTPVLGFQIPRITSGSHLESLDRNNALISDVSVLMSGGARQQTIGGESSSSADNVFGAPSQGAGNDANGAIRLTTSNVSLKDPFPSVPSGHNSLRQPFEGINPGFNANTGSSATPSLMGFVPRQPAPTTSTLPTHVYNRPSSMISKAIDLGDSSASYGSLYVGQRIGSGYTSQRKPTPIRSASMASNASVSSSASSLASAMDINLVRDRSGSAS